MTLMYKMRDIAVFLYFIHMLIRLTNQKYDILRYKHLCLMDKEFQLFRNMEISNKKLIELKRKREIISMYVCHDCYKHISF